MGEWCDLTECSVYFRMGFERGKINALHKKKQERKIGRKDPCKEEGVCGEMVCRAES